MPPTLGWPAVLDLLEARLAQVLEVADGADQPLPEPLTITPDGPLPEDLRLRAHSVLARSRQAETELRRRMAGESRAAVAYSQGS